ncbi:prepilin peptidase [Candidatus Dojkabacteria bacterium]|uniref:Prepilin peptidase n=1 Tax=Candidatus Dojkabacteria bacterium TaxID=2099670 RepID=A0A955L9K5_9BACT|nr:prepilin peptidase [Candidatus Dojkabacteria bacterium]
MNIFSVILFAFIGSCLGKLFFAYIEFENNIDFRKKLLEAGGIPWRYLLLFICTPASTTIVDHSAFKGKRSLLILTEIFGAISNGLFALSIAYLYGDSVLDSSYLVHFFFFYFGLVSLLYLSVYDLIYLAIPIKFTMRILFASVVIQIIIFTFKTIGILNSEIFSSIGTIGNIAGFLILYLGTFGLILITKEEGIGAGDADINGFVGLMLSIPGGIVFMFVTVFVGSIVGLVYAGILRKIKGVIIPMVPLICIGYTITIGFGENLLKLVTTTALIDLFI